MSGKSVILSTVPPHLDMLVPSSIALIAFQELQQACIMKIFMFHILQQEENLEKATRGQSKTKLWFHHRAVRLTASNFKGTTHANLAEPPQSLIK